MTESQAKYDHGGGAKAYWCPACHKYHTVDDHKRGLSTAAAAVAKATIDALYEHDHAMRNFGDQLTVLLAAFASAMGEMLNDEQPEKVAEIIDHVIARMPEALRSSVAIFRHQRAFDTPGPAGTDGSA